MRADSLRESIWTVALDWGGLPRNDASCSICKLSNSFLHFRNDPSKFRTSVVRSDNCIRLASWISGKSSDNIKFPLWFLVQKIKTTRSNAEVFLSLPFVWASLGRKSNLNPTASSPRPSFILLPICRTISRRSGRRSLSIIWLQTLVNNLKLLPRTTASILKVSMVRITWIFSSIRLMWAICLNHRSAVTRLSSPPV